MKNRTNKTIFLIFLILILIVPNSIEACKDIIACGDSTKGDYNLLLKVRDPSRPGLQVLCIVNDTYTYDYHHPWTGEPIKFNVSKKYIGVTTKEDVIPNIVKSGMVLTSAGLAFGDADSYSNWINPTKFAWDDFDWIRYACEKSNNTDEAVFFLTNDVVDKMHAPGVAENLFLVGPENGYIIEADAFRYNIKKIENEVAVMSNYPKELWQSQIHKKLPISPNFDTEKNTIVKEGNKYNLNSLFGVKIITIGLDHIVVRQYPFFKFDLKTILFMGDHIKINLGEGNIVGDFYVEVLEINNDSAKIQLCNKYYAWEKKLLEYINSEYGFIDLKNMMNWSRLTESDLDNLRPMCEEFYIYEAVAIYKIPNINYEILSSGWFSPNLACSSIYIPFHVSNTDIYRPYKTGEAATLSMDLFNIYGHENLTCFKNVEDVFLYENEFIEKTAIRYIDNIEQVTELLTISDINFQKQAWLTEKILYDIHNYSSFIIFNDIVDARKSGVEEIEDVNSELDDSDPAKTFISIKEKNFDVPFDLNQISDGTLIILAHLTIIYSPGLVS